MRGISSILTVVIIFFLVLLGGVYFILSHWGIISEPATEKACLLKLEDSFSSGDPGDCREITCLQIKKYCLATIGGKSSSCEEITDPLLQAKCMRSMALSRNDEKYCDNIPLSTPTYLERVTCQAQVSQDHTRCREGPLPERCMYSVAIYLRKSDICNEITDSELRSRCLHFLTTSLKKDTT